MCEVFEQSAPTLRAQDIAELSRLDGMILELALEIGAQEMQYPTLISRAALEQAEYPKAFPHLLMVAANLREPDQPTPVKMEPANLSTPQWCLSPAVCYHVYASLAGRQIDSPMIVCARGQCFRNEATLEPGRRQIEFAMREIVLIGKADWVATAAGETAGRLEQIARSAGLAGAWDVAEDPFFLPTSMGKAMMQRLKETKLEYRVDPANPLAVASVNRHGAFFGERFEIRDDDGEFVHTACIAAGLDRWVSGAAKKREEVGQCHR